MIEKNTHNKHNHFKMLTTQEMHDTTRERVQVIAKEFSDGFNFLEKFSKSVSVFGGLRFPEGSPYYELARTLTGKIARELGYVVVTGGGPGIMEAANRGAKEAGGQSLGLTIDLPTQHEPNKYITDGKDFYYFFTRKVCLAFAAEAYVFFPGGFGTMDEFFEILTLAQTKKIEKVSIILIGVEFWTKLETLVKEEMLSRGLVEPEDLSLYTITDDLDEAIQIIKDAPIRDGIKE
jgi:uncharacterized protein (TIGR00730 family)